MIKDFLLWPYSLLELRLFRWLFCLVGPILSFVYIYKYRPFGFSWFDQEEIVRLAFYYSAPVVVIWVIHLFVLQPLIVKRLNLLSTVAWLIWINLVISMYMYSFSEIYIFDSQFDWYFLPETMRMVYLMGGGETLGIMAVHFIFMLRQK